MRKSSRRVCDIFALCSSIRFLRDARLWLSEEIVSRFIRTKELCWWWWIRLDGKDDGECWQHDIVMDYNFISYLSGSRWHMRAHSKHFSLLFSCEKGRKKIFIPLLIYRFSFVNISLVLSLSVLLEKWDQHTLTNTIDFYYIFFSSMEKFT